MLHWIRLIGMRRKSSATAAVSCFALRCPVSLVQVQDQSLLPSTYPREACILPESDASTGLVDLFANISPFSDHNFVAFREPISCATLCSIRLNPTSPHTNALVVTTERSRPS